MVCDICDKEKGCRVVVVHGIETIVCEDCEINSLYNEDRGE